MVKIVKKVFIYAFLFIELMSLKGCPNFFLPWGPGGSQKSNVPAICSVSTINTIK